MNSLQGADSNGMRARKKERKKESWFKGKTDCHPCFWQRTKGLGGDQVTTMWHRGISVLHSLWLNIRPREQAAHVLSVLSWKHHGHSGWKITPPNYTVILYEGNRLLIYNNSLEKLGKVPPRDYYGDTIVKNITLTSVCDGGHQWEKCNITSNIN